MEIVYISGNKNIVEVSDAELQKITGDAGYTPAIGNVVDVADAWNNWVLVGSKKEEILQASANLIWLANHLP